MKFKKVNQSKGFTIIETLIVLAIAATIFLVVFLAVSALDRSSRNTARKDDAAAILAGIGDFVANNNGALPTAMSVVAAPNYQLTGGAGSVANDVKLAHYTAATFDTAAGGTTIGTGGVAGDTLVVDENSTCATSSTAAPGSTGAYAIVFNIESGSVWVQQCLGS
jgi:prepilin-type N-terminal cleavage/methylation domain-containing protein